MIVSKLCKDSFAHALNLVVSVSSLRQPILASSAINLSLSGQDPLPDNEENYCGIA